MKSASAELIALLQINTFTMADIYTFTLRDGSVYRFTNFDIDLTWDGNSYSKGGLLFKRNGVKLTTGIEVDNLSININQNGATIQGTTFFKLVANGGLDGANLELNRLFFTDPLNPVGAMWVFSGRVSESTVTRFEATLQVNSDTELLNVQMPRNLYQPSCVHSVYDAGCMATKTAVNKTVATGSTKQVIIASSISQSNGWFNEGMIEFTSGVNTGVRRTIKTHTGTNITLSLALPNTPAIGDAFSLYAGCDRTQNTCNTKFNNLSNFRGYPYLPQNEAVI